VPACAGACRSQHSHEPEAIQGDVKCTIADTVALIAFSEDKTGRSPKDKRVVEHPDLRDDAWWGSVNVPIDDATLDTNRERAIDYLNTRKRLYVVAALSVAKLPYDDCHDGISPKLMS
jgi:phosphoenolpyruvate carboxykinase (ATP)